VGLSAGFDAGLSSGFAPPLKREKVLVADFGSAGFEPGLSSFFSSGFGLLPVLVLLPEPERANGLPPAGLSSFFSSGLGVLVLPVPLLELDPKRENGFAPLWLWRLSSGLAPPDPPEPDDVLPVREVKGLGLFSAGLSPGLSSLLSAVGVLGLLPNREKGFGLFSAGLSFGFSGLSDIATLPKFYNRFCWKTAMPS
jgi:hypothetical protein